LEAKRVAAGRRGEGKCVRRDGDGDGDGDGNNKQERGAGMKGKEQETIASKTDAMAREREDDGANANIVTGMDGYGCGCGCGWISSKDAIKTDAGGGPLSRWTPMDLPEGPGGAPRWCAASG
jgi:hypothetical protein